VVHLKTLLLAGCIFAASTSLLVGQNKDDRAITKPATLIPVTGRIGDIRLGDTTIEHLESRFGKGKVVTGGHARGAREWVVKRYHCGIYADGFYYTDAGCVVDTFLLHKTDVDDEEDAEAVPISINRKKFAFMGGITLGMPQAKVMELLKKQKIKPVVKKDEVSWKEKGYVRINNETFETWTAKLTFRRDKLEAILIGCELKTAPHWSASPLPSRVRSAL
jgi:hypothetical protein